HVDREVEQAGPDLGVAVVAQIDHVSSRSSRRWMASVARTYRPGPSRAVPPLLRRTRAVPYVAERPRSVGGSPGRGRAARRRPGARSTDQVGADDAIDGQVGASAVERHGVAFDALVDVSGLLRDAARGGVVRGGLQ